MMSELEEVTAKIEQRAREVTTNTPQLGLLDFIEFKSYVLAVLGEYEKTHVVVEKKQLRELIEIFPEWTGNLSISHNKLLIKDWLDLVKKKLLGVKAEKELGLK